MSKKQYPFYCSPKKMKVYNFGCKPNELVCYKCSQHFTDKNQDIVIREIQNNWFRGDDDCEFYHVDCWGKPI
jgi:hypothetical protein